MLYTVICQAFRIIFRFFFRWRPEGRENIPAEGPVILCSNHISWWDPPLVGSLAWPRKVHFMAKEELFRYPVFSVVLPKILAFPVKRDTADRRAIRTALDVLKKGGVLGLFPEGTRSRTGEMLPPQPGVGLITRNSGAVVVPVAIHGPYRLFGPLRITIGRPLDFSQFSAEKARAEVLEEIAAAIMSEIGGMLASAQRR